MKDFFTRYRHSRQLHMILPAFLALGVSLMGVSYMQGTPIELASLKANVIDGIHDTPVYNADLIMEHTGGNLVFRIGKPAESVQVLYFSVIGDPANLLGLTSSDSDTTISMNEPGVGFVQVKKKTNYKAGEIITILHPTLSGETRISTLDAGFTSTTGEYKLSVEEQ